MILMLCNRGIGDMGSRGRERNTQREANLHQTRRPQVHPDIVGTPESIDGSPIMTVMELIMKPPYTGKMLLRENARLCKRQGTSMSVMEEGRISGTPNVIQCRHHMTYYMRNQHQEGKQHVMQECCLGQNQRIRHGERR